MWPDVLGESVACADASLPSEGVGRVTGKRALLIGVDHYAKFPPDKQLHGCVNDAEAMAALLEDRFGFPPDTTTLLRNEEADQQGIRDAAEALIAATGPDDVVVVLYSGHGSQRSSADPTEGDGLDETIVPHDSGRRPNPNLDIADKEINGWVRRLNAKTANLTLIFDCCHSGTITRDAFGETGRSVEPDLRPVAEMGLVEAPADGAGPASDVREADTDRGPSGWLPIFGRYVLIAGCMDAELSHEMEVGEGDAAVAHGALTYFLGQELAAAQPGTTYRDAFERASIGVSSRYGDQHPQMEGDARDRELFGTRDIAPLRFVPVSEGTDGQVTLGGGAIHGLAAGSEWDVYPESTKRVEGPDGAGGPERLGRVRVDRVGALSSTATLLEETTAGAVVPGSRAVEAVHAFPDQRLAVEVPDPGSPSMPEPEPVAGIRAAVEASPLLRAADEHTAELRVYLVPARDTAGPGDPVPQLPQVASPSWVVVGRDGRLATPVHREDEPGASEVVVENLEKLARYRRGLALANPDPAATLLGKVDFALMTRGPDGSWADATPASAGGQIEYAEGDPVAFRIVNHHTEPVYVTVLDFGLTGRIAQVHPPGGAADRLDPGLEIRVGVEPGRELPLEFPADFPFVAEPGQAAPVEGLETLKLVATTGRPVDFDLLLQEGVRGADDEDDAESPISLLLSMALRGQGSRDVPVQRLAAPPDEQWITVDRPFLLRRKGG